MVCVDVALCVGIQVFILGRMAHNTRALDILLRKIGSVTRYVSSHPDMTQYGPFS